MGQMTYRVVWEEVYGMLRKLASPESWAFTAYTGDNTAIHATACYLPPASSSLTNVDHPHHRTSCCLETDGCIGYLLLWMVHRGIRPRTSFAHRVALSAPTNYPAGGYKGAVKNWRTRTRPPKKQILMMSCARPQP